MSAFRHEQPTCLSGHVRLFSGLQRSWIRVDTPELAPVGGCHFGIQTFEDLVQHKDKLSLVETKIRQIPGQTSGLSWRYFLMLAGASHLTKPDRQVLRFLKTATGKSFSIEGAQDLLVAVCEQLRLQHSLISPRELDHLIWQFQRTR